MKKILRTIKFSFVFRWIAIFILFGFFSIYYLFLQTSEHIKKTNFQENIAYIDAITTNIAEYIKKNTHNKIYQALKKDPTLQHRLEEDLGLFITKKYRYIYVVDKPQLTSENFRFLLDGSKNYDDKSEFEESFTPLAYQAWNKAYLSGKTQYFYHKDIKSLWLTYLKPIVIDHKTQALIVVDFSLLAHKQIIKEFDALDNVLIISLIFGSVLFVIIVIFSYIDQKRRKLLEEKNKKIKEFNKELTKKVEEEVAKNRQKDKQLLQQSRLAQMGEMISMIAHQWRQPLSAINSAASAILIKSQLKKLEQETAQELSSKIISLSHHLSDTIDDFRNFFKPNKAKEKTTYKEMVESVLGIVETSLNKKGIKLETKIDDEEVFFTYPNEIKQVLLNLIKNAEDILLEREIQDPKISIIASKNILEVIDNGGGIADGIINKIFDPYFSTKSEKNGTGLGLYMSKTIIQEHCQGKLEVEVNNQNTIFRIELPPMKTN